MDFEISSSADKSFLNIKVENEITPVLLGIFLRATAEESIKTGIKNFLFDLRHASNQTGLGTHHNFVYIKSREMGFKPSSKHALLVNPKDTEDYKFVELLLINAGYDGKMFISEKKATEWLEK